MEHSTNIIILANVLENLLEAYWKLLGHWAMHVSLLRWLCLYHNMQPSDAMFRFITQVAVFVYHNM